MALIEVRNLCFTYKGGGARAVNDISFDIEQGEIFGFLGPSGAGKSTTQKILIRLLTGYEGQVTVMGKPLDSWGADFFEHTGVCFELPNHYQKLTALENLDFFRSLYAVETEAPRNLLEMVGLGQDADKPVSQFSKGMQMRLNFARSLLNRPDLIFLDEPTTGMDPVNARKIKDIIRRLKSEGRTIFLTTHNMTVADELCDRVAFIVDGEITLINSPRQLKLDHGRRQVKVEYHINSHTESIDFPLEGLENSEKFFELLRGRQVETIHTQEATLEDIFIQVTGRSLI